MIASTGPARPGEAAQAPQPGWLSLQDLHVSVRPSVCTLMGQVRDGCWGQTGPQSFSIGQKEAPIRGS